MTVVRQGKIMLCRNNTYTYIPTYPGTWPGILERSSLDSISLPKQGLFNDSRFQGPLISSEGNCGLQTKPYCSKPYKNTSLAFWYRLALLFGIINIFTPYLHPICHKMGFPVISPKRSIMAILKEMRCHWTPIIRVRRSNCLFPIAV